MEQLDPRLAASAMSAVWLIQVAVDILKSVIRDRQQRQWALPLAGVLLSWVIVAALQVHAGVPRTPEMVAGVILAGIVAYSMAASGNALHKAVRPTPPAEIPREDRVEAIKQVIREQARATAGKE